MTTALPSPPPLSILTPESLLAGSPQSEVRRLFVSTTEEYVTLTGTVTTYYHKQLAQETVRRAVRHRTIRNRIVVINGR